MSSRVGFARAGLAFAALLVGLLAATGCDAFPVVQIHNGSEVTITVSVNANPEKTVPPGGTASIRLANKRIRTVVVADTASLGFRQEFEPDTYDDVVLEISGPPLAATLTKKKR